MGNLNRYRVSKPVSTEPCSNHFEKISEVKEIADRMDRTSKLNIPINIKSELKILDFKAIDKAIRSSCYSCDGVGCHDT